MLDGHAEVGLRARRLRLRTPSATFAEQLEKNDAIKVYAKLPGWFKVPTPLGTYNPDWAVLVETEERERLYFVVETKGSLFTETCAGTRTRRSSAVGATSGRLRFASRPPVRGGRARGRAARVPSSSARPTAMSVGASTQ